jgi:hypothetical protein
MWHVNDEGIESGPFDVDELRKRYTAGAISSRAVVWREGMSGWQPIRATLKPRPTAQSAVGSNELSPQVPSAPMEESKTGLPPLVIAAYALGLGSFCCSFLSGVPGIICAVIAMMDPKTQKQGQVALIAAVICTIIGAIVNGLIGMMIAGG